MKKLFSIICLLIITLLIYSCKKEKSTNVSDFDIQAFEKCNNDLQLDTSEIANRLIGEWHLRFWRCAMCLNPGIHYPDKTVIATFTQARLFTITENSTIVGQGNWNLIMVDSSTNRWGLQSDNDLAYLNGFILFCNSQVWFSGNLDGNDNLFRRVN